MIKYYSYSSTCTSSLDLPLCMLYSSNHKLVVVDILTCLLSVSLLDFSGMYEAHPCTNFHDRSMPIEIFVCIHTKIHFRLPIIIVVDRTLLINQLLMSKIFMQFKLITTFWYTGKYIEVDLPVLHILRTN